MPIGRLTKLTLKGFKSIGDEAVLELKDRNVLIGANGAGKSNLISFFDLLHHAMQSTGELSLYVGRNGGARSFLFDGPSATPEFLASIEFATASGLVTYSFRLVHGSEDLFTFADEGLRRHGAVAVANALDSLGAGHVEPRLIRAASAGDGVARQVHEVFKGLVVYQFHNTSMSARMHQRWPIVDDRHLKADGGNLGPVLLRLQRTSPEHYERIVNRMRLVAPQFAGFELDDENGYVLLRWREKGSDALFGSHQASDGTLRAMALITLLSQPEDGLPPLLLLDEPELGLHPAALAVIAGLIHAASLHRQVVIGTQSASLLDHFEPADVVVVERPERSSGFRRLDAGALEEWLAEYTLSELWNKNVLGGRP